MVLPWNYNRTWFLSHLKAHNGDGIWNHQKLYRNYFSASRSGQQQENIKFLYNYPFVKGIQWYIVEFLVFISGYSTKRGSNAEIISMSLCDEWFSIIDEIYLPAAVLLQTHTTNFKSIKELLYLDIFRKKHKLAVPHPKGDKCLVTWKYSLPPIPSRHNL